MNLRTLEILEAVEQAGTFTGAAKKLHLTQSAVSHAVAELEQQTQTSLFDRYPRGVRLTPCGAALLAEARPILSACRSLDRRMLHLEDETPVTIVSSITIASFVLPQLIAEIQKKFPALRVTVRVASAAATLALLLNGEADIAFWEGAQPQGPFRTLLLGSYRLCAACAPSFLPSAQRLSPRRLCTLPLLLREPGSAIRDTFDSMLALANQKAIPVWESVNSAALIKAAEAGLGITILPDLLLSAPVRQKTLQILPVGGVPMHNHMLAVLHQDKYITRSLQALLDTLSVLRPDAPDSP